MADVKTLKVSADGITYYTLPGNTGDITFENEQLDDTIYGSEYASSQPGLSSASINGNAMYRGFAGYNSIIRRSGATPTGATGEAMSQVGATQTYRIDDTTKNVWDYNTPAIVYDNAVAVDAADIESINYLFGEVTFVVGYVVTGPVTVDASFFTMATYGSANEFNLTQTADTEDISTFDTSQANNGFRVYRNTLKQADLELSGFYVEANNTFADFKSRDEFVIEIDVAGDGTSIARGFYKINTKGQTAGVAETETDTLNLTLSVPEDIQPFGWYHSPSAQIPQGLLVIQDAWVSGDEIYYEYYPKGEANAGFGGNALVTDASMTSGVSAMVESNAQLQGTGEVLAI